MSTTIRVARVDSRGRLTGEADLSVDRDDEMAYLKLGMIRIELDQSQVERLMRSLSGGRDADQG